jgi:transcription initiation protein SPT3
MILSQTSFPWESTFTSITEIHGLEGLPSLRVHLLSSHLFKSFTFATAPKHSPETIGESQEDHGMEKENIFEGSFTNDNTKMMFVSGETAEPSPETTTLIEDITRQQVVEIVSTTNSI